MPKKDKRCKNNHGGRNLVSRELILADSSQTYGNILKSLGNCRFEVQCQDGAIRKCQVRGSMRNKRYVNVGDVVIVSLRDFQDDKGDIVHVYNGDETRSLKNMGELTFDIKKTENEVEENDQGFNFEDI